MDKPLAPLTPIDLPSWMTLAPSPEDADLDPDNPDKLATHRDPQDWRSLATPEQLKIIKDGSYAARSTREALYEALYPGLLERVASGQPLTAALDMSPHSVEYGRFLSWVKRDPDRARQYYEAQETGAEVVSEQMLAIADGSDSMEDVERSKLRINTRRYLLGVWNRKRFGEVKQQETTVTINLVEEMERAQARVDAARTIDVSGRIVNG